MPLRCRLQRAPSYHLSSNSHDLLFTTPTTETNAIQDERDSTILDALHRDEAGPLSGHPLIILQSIYHKIGIDIKPCGCTSFLIQCCSPPRSLTVGLVIRAISSNRAQNVSVSWAHNEIDTATYYYIINRSLSGGFLGIGSGALSWVVFLRWSFWAVSASLVV